MPGPKNPEPTRLKPSSRMRVPAGGAARASAGKQASKAAAAGAVASESSSGPRPKASSSQLRESEDDPESLARLSLEGPRVSMGKEIRGLFDRAISGEEAEHTGVAIENSINHVESPKSQGLPAASNSSSMAPVGNRSQRASQGDDLDEQLAATEAQALRLAMQREGRRLQAEAKQGMEVFESQLQEELEEKVMGLMAERDHKIEEANSLRGDLQRRIDSLHTMIAQLDDKAMSYAESYDLTLIELQKEYQALVGRRREKAEQENKAKLIHHMNTLREQRLMKPLVFGSPPRSGRVHGSQHTPGSGA